MSKKPDTYASCHHVKVPRFDITFIVGNPNADHHEVANQARQDERHVYIHSFAAAIKERFVLGLWAARYLLLN